MQEITRRQAITWAGLAAGGAWAATAGWMPSRAFGAPVLAATRRETYQALVEAVSAAPEANLFIASSEHAADHFARYYEARHEGARQGLDAALDELDRSGRGRAFRAMPVRERLDFLRHGPDRILAAGAVQLAALSIGSQYGHPAIGVGR